MSSVSRGPWTNEHWLGLMFSKCFTAFPFSLPLHTQNCTDTNTYSQSSVRLPDDDPDLTQLETQWGKMRENERDLPQNRSRQLVSARRDLVWFPFPNNNLKLERRKLGQKSSRSGQSGIKIQMPVFVRGREREAGWDCTQSPSNPLRR